eukprot:11778816-Alexandrium_andersonii.AAC.1
MRAARVAPLSVHVRRWPMSTPSVSLWTNQQQSRLTPLSPCLVASRCTPLQTCVVPVAPLSVHVRPWPMSTPS